MICMLTFVETIGDRNQHRQSRSTNAGLHAAESKDDASFELLDDAQVRSQPEHTKAERCGQCVEDDHFLSSSARASVVGTRWRARAVILLKRQRLSTERLDVLGFPIEKAAVSVFRTWAMAGGRRDNG